MAIGIWLTANWHPIGSQLASNWQSNDIGLDVNWHSIGSQLAMSVDWHSIGSPLEPNWHSIGSPKTAPERFFIPTGLALHWPSLGKDWKSIVFDWFFSVNWIFVLNWQGIGNALSKIGTALACWYPRQLNQFNANAPILHQSGNGLIIKKDSIGSGLVIVSRKKWGTLPKCTRCHNLEGPSW